MYIRGVHVFWLGGLLCLVLFYFISVYFSLDVFIFIFLVIFFVSLKH